jgi:hypothetical protein
VDALVEVADDAAPITTSRFAGRLALVSLVGLVVRVAAMDHWYRKLPLGFTDNFFYSVQADFLADGKGYSDPFHWEQTGRLIASADHPPLYSTYLAVFSFLGLDGATYHRLASCLLGAATVAVIGLVARRLAGDRAGLLAAVVAAVYPPLWIADGTLVAESPYALLIGLTVLASLRLADRRDLRSAAALGAVIGLAALTRSEGATLVVILVVPLLLVCPIRWGDRLKLLAVTGVVAGLVITPWFVRNLGKFEEPVPLAYGAGYVLKIGNCDPTYSGQMFGYWDISCAYAGALLPDKSVSEKKARAQAFDYIDAHRDRLPAVMAARVGRIWHLYRVEQGISFDVFFERRGRVPSELAVRASYLSAALAAVGAWALRHKRAALVTLGALVASATISAALAFGITRYRIPADVGLAILAGVGIDALLRRVRPPAPAPGAAA